MIFAKGKLLPDSDRAKVLAGLETEINATRIAKTLLPETVLSAVDALGRRLRSGELDALAAQVLPAGELAEVKALLRRETLAEKLDAELGPDFLRPREFARTTAHILPLGTLLHVAPGNQLGLGLYSVVEGLLTGNVNLLKLPRADKGASLAALSLLVEEAPELAEFLYAFDLPSSETEDLKALAALADGVVTWGGEGAVSALRALAPPGAKLIEWGHRLSFAYVSGYADKDRELAGLAEHIVATGQRLCSSCQVIFLDTEDFGEVRRFCTEFLPWLERAASARTGPGAGAQATLSGHTALLERIVEGRAAGEAHFPGRGCSVTARPDRELELSPMEGNVLVKALPRAELLPALRRQKGRLQTAGLLCAPAEREALTALLARAGVTRITRAGEMSSSFPGEGHDGEYSLRRYIRIVDVEKEK